jgi:hypothetical protein
MTRDKAIELARAATVRSSAADWEPNPAFTDPLVDVLEGLGLLKFDEPEPTPATHWVPIAGTMTMGVADGDHKVRREAICREDDLVAVLRQAGFTVIDNLHRDQPTRTPAGFRSDR